MSFGLRKFRAQYGDAFAGTDLLEEKPGAWRCRIRGLMDEGCWVLCNPEDVIRCTMCKGSDELCGDCKVPLCRHCFKYIRPGGLKGGIPGSLANDNFWDETCSLLYKYNVTWLERAIASPCWTTLLVCYLEGDKGHLMNEQVEQQRWRTRIKGSVASFQLPE